MAEGSFAILKGQRRPVPRPDAFNIFWQFTAERQRVFESRLAGRPGPWTTDPILKTYKFCNVYRAADRVSQYLIRDIAYAADDVTAVDRVFQITAFRTFSNTATWDAIVRGIGRGPTIDDLADGTFERVLSKIRDEVGRLYTGAFILCATDAYGRRLKHLNHVELFKHMFLRARLAEEILEADSLRQVYDLLHRFPLMGDFMSYQTAIDINYSSLTNFNENEFTQPGPGALRGMKKVFLSSGGLSPSELVHWMVDEQDNEFAKRDLQFSGLFGRSIHAIDAQNLFCETDKYCRVALPALQSARTNIKAKHKPNPSPIDYFFPPKWNLGTQALTKVA